MTTRTDSQGREYIINQHGARFYRNEPPLCMCCGVLSGDWKDDYKNPFCRMCAMICDETCRLMEAQVDA